MPCRNLVGCRRPPLHRTSGKVSCNNASEACSTLGDAMADLHELRLVLGRVCTTGAMPEHLGRIRDVYGRMRRHQTGAPMAPNAYDPGIDPEDFDRSTGLVEEPGARRTPLSELEEEEQVDLDWDGMAALVGVSVDELREVSEHFLEEEVRAVLAALAPEALDDNEEGSRIALTSIYQNASDRAMEAKEQAPSQEELFADTRPQAAERRALSLNAEAEYPESLLFSDVLDAIVWAEMVDERAKNALDATDPKVIGNPRPNANGVWKDGGLYHAMHQKLRVAHRKMKTLWEQAKEGLRANDWRMGNPPKTGEVVTDYGNPDPEKQITYLRELPYEELDPQKQAAIDYNIDTLTASEDNEINLRGSDIMVALAIQVRVLTREVLEQKQYYLDEFPKPPGRPKVFIPHPNDPDYVVKEFVNKDHALDVYPYSFHQRKPTSPVNAPTPSPTLGGDDDEEDAEHAARMAKWGLVRAKKQAQVLHSKRTPCEYFAHHMSQNDPILYTQYDYDSMEVDWAYWRSLKPPRNPTMNMIFIKRWYPTFRDAYGPSGPDPNYADGVVEEVVRASLPSDDPSDEWRRHRNERFYIVDGTNLFYSPDIAKWDERGRIKDVQNEKIPFQSKYGPIIVIMKTDRFEASLLKQGSTKNDQFFNDTGLRVLYDKLRPLHGGYDYPIHIVEICADRCDHIRKAKSEDPSKWYPCMEYTKPPNAQSECRVLTDDPNATPQRQKEHKWCEYDDAVATLINDNLRQKNKTVVVLTGEGGKRRTGGVRKFLKSQDQMRELFGDLYKMDDRISTRIYRMGYSRALRLFVMRKQDEEAQLDANVRERQALASDMYDASAPDQPGTSAQHAQGAPSPDPDPPPQNLLEPMLPEDEAAYNELVRRDEEVARMQQGYAQDVVNLARARADGEA